jgi:hypothetical protein
MILTILLFLSGIAVSVVGAYYSILGLAALFAGAYWAVIYNGSYTRDSQTGNSVLVIS